jgi:hypothetical protein
MIRSFIELRCISGVDGSLLRTACPHRLSRRYAGLEGGSTRRGGSGRLSRRHAGSRAAPVAPLGRLPPDSAARVERQSTRTITATIIGRSLGRLPPSWAIIDYRPAALLRVACRVPRFVSRFFREREAAQRAGLKGREASKSALRGRAESGRALKRPRKGPRPGGRAL